MRDYGRPAWGEGVLQGPQTMDPARLDEARRAYDEDLRRYEPQLVDDKGQSNAVSPFITQADGSSYFNRWIDSENRQSAQNSWFDDKDDKTGKVTRRPSWQEFPRFAYEQSQGQFDTISSSLRALQEGGLKKMQDLYKGVIGSIG